MYFINNLTFSNLIAESSSQESFSMLRKLTTPDRFRRQSLVRVKTTLSFPNLVLNTPPGAILRTERTPGTNGNQ